VPTSDYTQIPDVIRVVIESGAESVLDIGIGFGKWGALCREYIEISRGRMPAEWRSRIDGIEMFEGYRNPMWNVYDQVHLGDARLILDALGSYDLVICTDVIEHFEKHEGQVLLEKMLDRGRVVLITSPIGPSPQEAVYGNPHEEHKSVWGESDFEALPHRFAELNDTFIVAASRNAAHLARVDIRSIDERLGFRNTARMLGRLALRRLRARG
jgi:hypothetical protein